MKKTVFILAVTAGLISCGGGSDVKKDAEAVCDCYEKANASGNAEEQQKCQKEQAEAWDKYKGNVDDAKTFNDIIGECSRKMMEDALKGN